MRTETITDEKENQFARKDLVEPEKTRTIEEIFKEHLQTFQKPPKMPTATLLLCIFISLIVGVITGFLIAQIIVFK